MALGCHGNDLRTHSDYLDIKQGKKSNATSSNSYSFAGVWLFLTFRSASRIKAEETCRIKHLTEFIQSRLSNVLVLKTVASKIAKKLDDILFRLLYGKISQKII